MLSELKSTASPAARSSQLLGPQIGPPEGSTQSNGLEAHALPFQILSPPTPPTEDGMNA